MNKIYLFVVLLILTSCHSEPKNSIIDKWDNGNTKLLYSYDNASDSSNYTYESFYKNGKPKAKGKFIKGKKEGLWQWWFVNGKRMDEAVFSDDLYINERKHWDTNGALNKIEYLSGKCNGDCCDGKIEFYSSGTKYAEYIQRSGEWNGLCTTFYSNGKKKRSFIYENGIKNGISFEYDEMERLLDYGNYSNDKANGFWVSKDTLGNVTEKFSYKDDVYNGPDSAYYSNGKVRITGNFLMGKEDGAKIFYDTFGNVTRYEFYKNGFAIKKTNTY